MPFGMAPERARHVGLDKNDLLMEVPFESRQAKLGKGGFQMS